MVRTYLLTYRDNATFFRDLRTLLGRAEMNDVYNMWLPDGSGGFVYQLNASIRFSPERPPDDAFLLRGLAATSADVAKQDLPYLDYVMQVKRLIDFLTESGLWSGVQHPWFDVFLSDERIESFVGEVIPTLTPEDVGPAGFVLMLVAKADKLRRPRLRVPRGTRWIYLFDVLTGAAAPGDDPAFARRMLQRNRAWFERARSGGGFRYPIGSLEFSRLDWARHYGETSGDVLAAKLKYDPARILAPGLKMF
jgi:hypothetical protein